MVDASSASTPLIRLRLPSSRLSPIRFLRRFFLGLISLTASSFPSRLPTLPESGLLPVTSPLGPSRFGVDPPQAQFAVGDGGWRGFRRGGSWSPLPVEAHLPPVRAGPEQSSLHQPAHHHVSEVATEILEIQPEEINEEKTTSYFDVNYTNLIYSLWTSC